MSTLCKLIMLTFGPIRLDRDWVSFFNLWHRMEAATISLFIPLLDALLRQLSVVPGRWFQYAFLAFRAVSIYAAITCVIFSNFF